jgi:hypothetical protein
MRRNLQRSRHPQPLRLAFQNERLETNFSLSNNSLKYVRWLLIYKSVFFSLSFCFFFILYFSVLFLFSLLTYGSTLGPNRGPRAGVLLLLGVAPPFLIHPSNVYASASLHGKIHYKKLSKPSSSLQTVFQNMKLHKSSDPLS